MFASTTPTSAAAAGYAQSTESAGTPRSIEHQAFQRVTAMLMAARADDAPFTKKAEAVYLNTRLWITLAADLVSPKNQLPVDLRAQLFGLAEFSRRHGLLVLSNEAGVDDLIEVNRAIMRGLRGESAIPSAPATNDDVAETASGARPTDRGGVSPGATAEAMAPAAAAG